MKTPKILQNIFSLTVAEIATKGITFFLYFYLARILSVEGYGIMSNVAAIIGYLVVIVALGLREIGIRSTAGKPELVQKYFSNITSIKLFLAVIAFLVLCVYIYVNDFSYLVVISFIFGSIQLFAYAIQTEWIFIANERIHILAVRQILVSAITLLGVLLFVKSINDLPLYFFIFSISLLINNFWLIKFANIVVKLECDIKFIKSLLKQSLPLGLADILTAIICSFGIVYLSQTSTNEQTGLFSAAFKLITLSITPALILYNTYTSKISQSETNFSKINISQKYSTFVFAVGAIIAAVFFVFADFNLYITFGKEFLPATNLLKILSLYSLGFYISYSALPLLKYWKYEKKILVAYLIATLIVVALTIILSNFYNSTGTAIASTIGELSFSIILIIFLFKVLHKVFILKIFPFLAGAFSITLLSRFTIELFTSNINYLSIAIVFSVAIYFFIIVKFKIINTNV